MEDFSSDPRHRNKGFGGVIIPSRTPSNEIILEETMIGNVSGTKPLAMIKLRNGGTAFFISNKKFKIGDDFAIGLALTAAHLVLKLPSLKPEMSTIQCGLQCGESCKALIVTHYSASAKESTAPSTGRKYCLNGDLAILLVTCAHSVDVDFFEISEVLTVGTDCLVSGYPRPPSNLRSCFLGGFGSANPLADARRVFHDFSQLVHAGGKIKDANDCLVEVSCSTTSGMSGSPIIANEKVVGVYLGGPPLPGQKELFDIAMLINNMEVERAWEELQKLAHFDSDYNAYPFDRLLTDATIQRFVCYNRIKSGINFVDGLLPVYKKCQEGLVASLWSLDDTLYNFMMYSAGRVIGCIYELVTCFIPQSDYMFNVGICIKEPCFLNAKEILQRYKNVQGEYINFEQLLMVIS